jgi:hypothetical protein
MNCKRFCWAGLSTCLILGAMIGCDGNTLKKEKTTNNEVSKTALNKDTSSKQNRFPKKRGRKARKKKPFPFAGQIEKVFGSVTIAKYLNRQEQPISDGEMIHSGDIITTKTASTATVLVRSAGMITLGENGRVLVTPYESCGAMFVHGTMTFEGAPNHRKNMNCHLHTPTVAVRAPGQKATIYVGEDRQVIVGAPIGVVRYFDTQGNPHDLPGGQQIAFDAEGDASIPKPYAMDQDTSGQFGRKWLSDHGSKGTERLATANTTLNQTEKLVIQIDLDVNRLIELIDQTSALTKERKKAAADPNTPGDQLAKVTNQLIVRSEEKTRLRQSGLLKVQRVIVLGELANWLVPENAEITKRITLLRGRLEEIKKRLLSIFTENNKSKNQN